MISSKLHLSRLHPRAGRPSQAQGLSNSARPTRSRAACRAEGHSQQHLSDNIFLMSMLQALAATQARAEEAARPVEDSTPPVDVSIPAATELTPGQLALLFSPVLIYGAFSIYRAKVNPKASISDLLLIVALCAILFNLYSIVFLKVRYF
ncbi:hypothetical protein DUNSADRAFT_6957 [Dunaliella salina]|uniref:Uncharacterized protein n=1 Tax=Dunaliella salina TaxID=3046 RepID=A0ABQ7GMA5_DUNSA|nr:hypothetical protein DUNSADRAFT_6957 [Dunaliella salina]|eukprot:KAF5835731.1 hypothetical protein DUNSADRAFT_6957 [Dunaliella salina]